MKKAVFVGSFDPFTEGHAAIVGRALALFDRLVIGVGVNPDKHCMFSPDERVAAIRQRYANEQRIEVRSYADWTADFAQREGACCIVKGVRNADDYIYEQQQALFNRERSGIETILLVADEALKDISSTRIRQQLLNSSHSPIHSFHSSHSSNIIL